jgi:hypothetical protein
MSKSRTDIRFVFPLFTAAALTLLILKICGFTFSWLWIPAVWLAPAWIMLGIVLGIIGLILGVLAIVIVGIVIVAPFYLIWKGCSKIVDARARRLMMGDPRRR